MLKAKQMIAGKAAYNGLASAGRVKLTGGAVLAPYEVFIRRDGVAEGEVFVSTVALVKLLI